MSQYKLAVERPQGTANIRVFTPTVDEHGWSADGHTVVEVVTDDMPFLVDSVTMVLDRAEPRGAHRRAPADPGPPRPHRQAARGAHRRPRRSTGPTSRTRSAASRGCTSRSPASPARLSTRRSAPRWPRSSATSASRSRTGRGCTARRGRSSTTSRSTRPRWTTEEIDEAKSLLNWLADDHFTFLGYREYKLETGPASPTRTCTCGGARHRVYGILRSDPDMSDSVGKLPELVRERAREKSPAGAGEGQLQGHRAPSGLPRLRRREVVRRLRRDRRRAPLPRTVLLGGVHRVARSDPGAAQSRPSR